MPIFVNNVDMSGYQLLNFRVQVLAVAPANPAPGQIYYNSAQNTYYGWNGSAWIDLGQVLNGPGIVALINGSVAVIDDDNLSAIANDAFSKRHAHANKAVLDAIEAAYTSAEKTKLAGVSTGATKAEQSATNGSIKIDGVDRVVYTHPAGTNPHGTTKADVGLGNVENKSSATIRGEITSGNVTTALGFTPVKNGGATPEIREGLESARPAATGSGLLFFATDTKKIWKDTAANVWTQMGGQDLPVASQSTLGGIKVGANLTVLPDGTLNANDNPSNFIIRQELFTVAPGQSVFTLTKGTYKPGSGTLFWYMFGDKQPNGALLELSPTTFGIVGDLEPGTEILVEYIELINTSPYPAHAGEHVPGGVDPIPLASGAAAGLMAAADKGKLDGVAANANNYVHPTSAGNKHVPTGGASGQVVKYGGSSGTGAWGSVAYSEVTGTPTLGTAASKNTGTASGDIPILGTGGKLDVAVLPALAVTDTFVVSTQAAMLALSAEPGDVCVRTDISKSFILKAEPASTLANWQELLTPTDTVSSVNGKTGVVTLTKADVGLGNVDNVQQAPATRVITAGNGLTGGGDLTADRTLTLGTPSTITPSSTNSTTTTSHTHAADIATQAEAEAGTSTAKFMTPQRTAQAVAALQAVMSVAGKTGTVTLVKGDVGLGNVDNVQQATKTEFTAHDTDAVRHITAGERTSWNAKTGKFVANIGDGSATQFTVAHALNSLDVAVSLRESAAPRRVVYADVEVVDANNVLLIFGGAPTTAQYRVTVVG